VRIEGSVVCRGVLSEGPTEADLDAAIDRVCRRLYGRDAGVAGASASGRRPGPAAGKAALSSSFFTRPSRPTSAAHLRPHCLLLDSKTVNGHGKCPSCGSSGECPVCDGTGRSLFGVNANTVGTRANARNAAAREDARSAAEPARYLLAGRPGTSPASPNAYPFCPCRYCTSYRASKKWFWQAWAQRMSEAWLKGQNKTPVGAGGFITHLKRGSISCWAPR